MRSRVALIASSLALLTAACNPGNPEPDTGSADEQGEVGTNSGSGTQSGSGGSDTGGADTGSESSESGAELGDCSERTNPEDCAKEGEDPALTCGWFQVHEASIVDGACELGESTGICVTTGRGSETCGGPYGIWFQENNGMFLVADMTDSCDGLSDFIACETELDPPAVCDCAL